MTRLVDLSRRSQEAPLQNAHPIIILTLKNITAGRLISSLVTLVGTGAAFESQIGPAVIYDRAYAAMGQATVHGNSGAGMGNYSTKVSHSSCFPGVQEGMVAVYQGMGGLSAENETAVKVFVNPTPGSTLLDPAYWTQSAISCTAMRSSVPAAR